MTGRRRTWSNLAALRQESGQPTVSRHSTSWLPRRYLLAVGCILTRSLPFALREWLTVGQNLSELET